MVSRHLLRGRWILIGVIAVALVGCGESTGPLAGAPELPPARSMQIDLGLFEGKQAAGVQDLSEGTQLNFLNAAVRAAYVEVAVVTLLTPPSLAFAAAVNTVPSRDEDGSYVWIYTWLDQGQEHQIRLRGMPGAGVVDWEMYVQFAGQESVLWFTGQSRTDRDEGYWIFHDFGREGNPEALRLDWATESESDASLDLRNVLAGDEEEGDELRYRAEGSERRIDYADASSSATWDIQWDAVDGTGSLKVPDYNDGERACWDENQEDVACPAAAADAETALR